MQEPRSPLLIGFQMEKLHGPAEFVGVLWCPSLLVAFSPSGEVTLKLKRHHKQGDYSNYPSVPH